MQNNCAGKSRIEWVDYLKGISILLVIIGHTIGNFYIRSTIFSFHMPLFFFLSGFTGKLVVDKDAFKVSVCRSFKRYVIPAYIVWILRNIAYWFINNKKYTLLQYLLSALFASGIEMNIKGLIIPAFGMMWFLIVLFETRIICNVIGLWFHRINVQIIVVAILAFLGIVCPGCLPFSLDVALVSMVFFFTGIVLRDHKKVFENSFYTIAAGILWGGVLIILLRTQNHFELATRNYPYGLCSLVMAASACYFICSVTQYLTRLPIKRFLLTVGRNSMTLFVIHAFDAVWYPFLMPLGNKVIVLALRLLIDLSIFFVVYFLKQRGYLIASKHGKDGLYKRG